MRLALYHPRDGYYATRVPGHGGDYGTSPSLTPWFGALLVRELQAMWEALECPDPFTVTEVGAGRADLAAGALQAAGPLAGALRWRIVERFDEVQELQRARLGAAASTVEWLPSLGPPAVAGCVLAHEVIDNFPVHLVEVGADGQPREVYVGMEGTRLVEQLGPVTPGIAAAARAAAQQLEAGRRFEVCEDLQAWCADASATIERGYLLVVDYGDTEANLWRASPRGTVVTYGPDGFGEDPLAAPGSRDITADVNFSAVSRMAEQVGFAPQLFCTQRSWLKSLGLDDVAAGLEADAERAWGAGRNEEGLRVEGELSLLLALAGHMGLGDIMVFRAAKGAPPLGARRGAAG
jgi:SAM-dependent MidA family methyltransferase